MVVYVKIVAKYIPTQIGINKGVLKGISKENKNWEQNFVTECRKPLKTS